MNERIQKCKEDYAKNEHRIAVLQDKNKKLLAKITQLENEEIIGLVRESNLNIAELSKLLGKGKDPISKIDMEENDDEIQE